MKEMISLSERLLAKTTICLTAGVSDLRFGRESLTWQSGGVEKSVPIADIRRVIIIGNLNLPARSLYKMMRMGFPVDWLNIMGEPAGQILPAWGNFPDTSVAAQEEFCSGADAFPLAKKLVLAKFDNSREVLRRRVKPDPLWPYRRMDIVSAESAPSLRGKEGMGARLYFSHWGELLGKFPWPGRKSRPSADPVNMLLSLGYTLVYNRLVSALRHAGLNPRLGFYHQGRGTHCALASDLMEPLRPLVDAVVLGLVRHREVKPEQFTIKNDKCRFADKNAFPLVLKAFEKMFAHEYPFFYEDKKHPATLNDSLDDLALGFALHINQQRPLPAPRLTKCPATSLPTT